MAWDDTIKEVTPEGDVSVTVTWNKGQPDEFTLAQGVVDLPPELIPPPKLEPAA